jgi:DNA-directed RNA polymerase specialized sigma24 family protein
LPDPLDSFDYDAALAACAAGDQAALRRLYDQEGARLLGVAKRIVRDTALAEDIVHDAFIKIWTGAGSFDPLRGAARGWMYTVTRHLALNTVRDNAREIGVDDATVGRGVGQLCLAGQRRPDRHLHGTTRTGAPQLPAARVCRRPVAP